jgi:hypothetical protein
MTTELVLPSTLAGFKLGSELSEVDASAFLEDGEGYGTTDLVRFDPYVAIVVDGSVVVSITAADECWFGGLDLVGMPTTEAVDAVGARVIAREGSPVEIVELEGGLEFYCRDGVVSRVVLSDWSLVND